MLLEEPRGEGRATVKTAHGEAKPMKPVWRPFAAWLSQHLRLQLRIALNSPSAGQALQDTPSVAGATVPGGTKEDESQEVAAENDAVAHGQDPVNPAEQAAAMLQSWGIPAKEDEHGNIPGGGRGRGGRGRAGRAGRARSPERGLKKPAAASPMKALLKKPASSTSTVQCTRAAMSKLTKAERVRYRPHGCHKCGPALAAVLAAILREGSVRSIYRKIEPTACRISSNASHAAFPL